MPLSEPRTGRRESCAQLSRTYESGDLPVWRSIRNPSRKRNRLIRESDLIRAHRAIARIC
jgi:hypothetical protein